MIKIVINRCYGGFGLSDAGLALYNAYSDKCLRYSGDIERDDPNLIRVVEELGVKANNCFANMKVVLVPNGVSWHIEEHDGTEWVAEDHRIWS